MTWSPEVRVLMKPSAVFRELTCERTGGARVMLRRPLLLALFAGCTVSLQASGRLSVRLVADGIVSFAFVPFFEIVALAVVYARCPRRVPFARAIDAFFAANAPWLLWLLAFSVLRCVQTPLQATAMPAALLWTLVLSLVLTAAWSAFIDLQFFREVLPPQHEHAVRDLLLARVISWTGILGYFLGIAIWAELAAWIGV
jgi:hypothetical protein